MPAYVIARVRISDPAAYKEYRLHTPRTIRQYGGRFVARGGETVTLEGQDEGLRVVIIEFPSLERAREWYGSAEYQAVRALREGAGEMRLVAIEGYPPEEWERVAAESEARSLPGQGV
jgi:uncharacterized protein (DUF1330 family)